VILAGIVPGSTGEWFMSWEVVSCWIEGHPGLASWVQAIGSIAAIMFAIFVAGRESRLRRRSEAEAKNEALVRAYTTVDDTVRRVGSAFKTADQMCLDRTSMILINSDLNQALEHLKEVISSPGVDSKIYGELFVVRTAVEDVVHSLNTFAQATERESDLLDLASDAVNQVMASREILRKMIRSSVRPPQ